MMEMKIINSKEAIIEKDISLRTCSVIKKEDPILCDHCLRTSSNGIRCMGICVADNEY